jgi:hypothetical protein
MIHFAYTAENNLEAALRFFPAQHVVAPAPVTLSRLVRCAAIKVSMTSQRSAAPEDMPS